MVNLSVCYVASHAINSTLEGHNIAAVRIIQAAVNAGVKAKVVSLENSPVNPKKNFYPIKTLLKATRKTSYVPSIFETLSSFPAMLKAKDLNCDVIHLLNVTKEVFILSKKLLSTDGICVPHYFHSSFPFSKYPTFKIRSLFLRLGIFSHVLSSNNSLIHYLTKELKLNVDNVHLVPYPVDVNLFKPRNKQKLREKYEIPSNVPVVAYVGALDSDRGFFFLLNAFRKILKNIPQAILYVCHPNTRMKLAHNLLKRYTVSPRITSNILFKGPNPFIEEVYSFADVIAIPFQKPYWITAPPLVLLEAMASATPIVTTPVDVIKDIGTDMIDMIFTIPGNLDSVVNAIFYALENQDESRIIGLKAREKAVKDFSVEIVGEKLRKTYEEICVI
jgi:glycosyltransferase involved in cell wall biosynthesis